MHNLFCHALSYATSFEGILRDKDEFQRNLETLLTPYFETPHHVAGDVITWGFEYKRPHARA